ncbi:MAG: 3-oxoacyl-[acyl-carrier-protein] reductase [Candidatus Cloacimonetes bacterium]|nr:3-oxoacyl-[acyl-carrier-protein] reductase [Candidatus Cloacimonadota bacterium]
MIKRLENKVAVITGAARGIGFGIAEKYAVEGAFVVLIDLKQEDVDIAVEKLTAAGHNAAGYEGNVANSEAITTVFKTILKNHNQIDILVNNAGITRDNLLMRMKESDWDAVINVNLKGTFNCTQQVLRPMMKKRSGAIINVASVIGLMGNAGQANYAASKAGIIALTKSTAKEMARRGIRCNAIAPGFIETDMTRLPEDVIKTYAEAIPLFRMGSIEDVANLCLFLASDEASYITGQTIQVDGGLIM